MPVFQYYMSEYYTYLTHKSYLEVKSIIVRPLLTFEFGIN